MYNTGFHPTPITGFDYEIEEVTEDYPKIHLSCSSVTV